MTITAKIALKGMKIRERVYKRGKNQRKVNIWSLLLEAQLIITYISKKVL